MKQTDSLDKERWCILKVVADLSGDLRKVIPLLSSFSHPAFVCLSLTLLLYTAGCTAVSVYQTLKKNKKKENKIQACLKTRRDTKLTFSLLPPARVQHPGLHGCGLSMYNSLTIKYPNFIPTRAVGSEQPIDQAPV